MSVFRVERNKWYTVMCNYHLRGKVLSLKAKGLLPRILSLPEDWAYTLSGLCYINRESKDAICSAVNELERAGCIERHQTTDESGHMELVMDCMRENTAKIRSIKKYLLAVLFNAPSTMGSCYTALVAHDMAEG